jgi:hypothetical protein
VPKNKRDAQNQVNGRAGLTIKQIRQLPWYEEKGSYKVKKIKSKRYLETLSKGNNISLEKY